MRKALINNIELTGNGGEGKLVMYKSEKKNAKKEMEQFMVDYHSL